MKKIISFVLAAAMSLSTLPVLADWNNDEDIMSLLSELNIMVGDDDGNLRLDDNVSRAEDVYKRQQLLCSKRNFGIHNFTDFRG